MPTAPKRFKRVIEDFKCFNCNTIVKGSGYTDHCPNCLWSMHVDNFPGDRAAKCRGKMRPTSVVYKGDGYLISYTCLKCGKKKEFKASENDDKEVLLSLVKNLE
jgi:hypothetical protein